MRNSDPVLLRLKAGLAVYYRPVLVSLGLSSCLSAAFLWAIFQGLLLPSGADYNPPAPSNLQASLGPLSASDIFYLMFFGTCLLAPFLMQDAGRSILGYLFSYVISGIVVFEVLSFPGLSSPDSTFTRLLESSALNWTFTAVFPVPLFIGIAGTVLGVALGEKYSS